MPGKNTKEFCNAFVCRPLHHGLLFVPVDRHHYELASMSCVRLVPQDVHTDIFQRSLREEQFKLRLPLAMDAILCTKKAATNSQVDVIGHVRPVYLFPHRVLHLTCAGLAS